jgi:hypothetical protein
MRVEWTDAALDRLADLFVAADPAVREAIEQSVIGINNKLAVDPWDLGESRATVYRRAWSTQPLFVIFHIIPAESLVVVQTVNLFGAKSA